MYEKETARWEKDWISGTMKNAVMTEYDKSMPERDKGHAMQRHVKQPKTELLDAAVNDITKSRTKSSFISEEMQSLAISAAVTKHMKDIIQWIKDGDEPTKEIEVKKYRKDDNGYIMYPGYGIHYDAENGRMQDLISPDAKAILKKTNTNRYGFFVLTAYPDLSSPDAEPAGTPINFSAAIKQTATFATGTPKRKAYLLYCADQQKKPPARYLRPDGTNPERIIMGDPHGNYILFKGDKCYKHEKQEGGTAPLRKYTAFMQSLIKEQMATNKEHPKRPRRIPETPGKGARDRGDAQPDF